MGKKPDLAAIAKKYQVDDWEKDQELLRSPLGDPLTIMQIQQLQKDRLAQYAMVGMAEDYTKVVVKDEEKKIQKLKDKLKNYRIQARFFSLEELKKQI